MAKIENVEIEIYCMIGIVKYQVMMLPSGKINKLYLDNKKMSISLNLLG